MQNVELKKLFRVIAEAKNIEFDDVRINGKLRKEAVNAFEKKNCNF